MQGSGPCDSSSNLLRATTNAAGRPRLRVREPSFAVRLLIFPRSFAVSRETLFSPCTKSSREAAKDAKRERKGTLHPSRLRALRVRHCSLPVPKVHTEARGRREGGKEGDAASFAASRSSREMLSPPCTEGSREEREEGTGGNATTFAASRPSRETLFSPCTEGSREAAKSAKREREGTLQPSRLRALRVRHCSPNTKKSRETAKDARGNPGCGRRSSLT
jgi:hypothetical protein